MKLRMPVSRARAIGAAIDAAVLFAVGFVPLFDGPGYEQSLAAGLVLPVTAAIVAAVEGFEGARTAAKTSPFAVVARGLATGALLSLVAVVVSLIHVLRVGACDVFGGVVTFALGGGVGACLGGALGATGSIAVGHLFDERRRRRRWAIALAVAFPLASIVVDLLFFYFTPAVFAFDPFVGFFSGALYDVVVDATTRVLTYRAGTALTLGAIVVGAFALSRDDHGKAVISRRNVMLVAFALALGSATLAAFGEPLGHRTSAWWIRHELGGHRSGPRCDVWFPMDTDDRDAELLLRDCEEEIVAVTHRLNVDGPPRVTAFFFRDPAQKRILMGAAQTYIAKPWRREVYLQVEGYPHPILAHELSHVVAGTFGQGPFRVAGGADGLAPNTGLIEGIAVAAGPEKDELTPAQWAHAMKELDLLPRLSSLFGVGFFASNSEVGYTVAGAFVGWWIDRGKVDAVRAWYHGVPFEQAFGTSFDQAEKDWRASLDEVPLPPEALAVAKARFDRPAIWGRRCPHVVERWRDEAEECRARGDGNGEESALRHLLSLDVADPSARVALAKLAAERGDDANMDRMLLALLDDPRLSATWRARIRETLGDDALRTSALQNARDFYAKALTDVIDEDRARNLEVKLWIAGDADRARLFRRALVRPVHGPDEATASLVELATFAANDQGAPESLALARYLLARRLFDAKSYADAAPMLEGLDALATITPRLPREVARLRLVIACLSPRDGREARVHDALERYRAVPQGNAGRTAAAERLAEVCTSTGY